MKFFTFCLMFIPFYTFSQYQFEGEITSSGEPVENAIILVDSTSYFTNENGSFLFTNERKEVEAIITYLNSVKRVNLSSNIFNALEIKPDLSIEPVFISEKYPITYNTVSNEEIESINLGQDIPILLDQMPSITTTSDAGGGVGYTGIRVRGSDATRVNVTINGIPLNDAESQGVFWVNMPDFASNTDKITLVRGVGTSTNGAGAFGASLHLETEQSQEQPFVEYAGSVGTFNTFKNTLRFGTGNQNKWFASGRLSQINSDGFIDRATADLQSYFFQAGRTIGRNDSGEIKFVTFKGKEVTYQAWNGVSEQQLAEDRTFNVYTYENQVDDYQQEHYQLLFDQQMNDFDFNIGLHYTAGQGFFEEFREQDALANYGLEPILVNGQAITNTDLVRRRWLDNDFYGVVGHTNYEQGSHFVTLGGSWNRYLGDHFGEIIQGQFIPTEAIGQNYYQNDATKKDETIYAKYTYDFPWESGLFRPFIDLQYRGVNYDFVGLALDGNGQVQDLPQSVSFSFFNPKVGFSYEFGSHQIYGLFARAQKEPNRNDFVDSPANQLPVAEELSNYELGYSYQDARKRFAVNTYWMDYTNQLALTGGVNDVGAFTRVNVDDSYRLGVELETAIVIDKKNHWQVSGNATFSQNRIDSFTEQLDNFDTGIPTIIEHKDTDLALSPSVIAGGTISYQPNHFRVALLNKYVGEQFLDNTSTDSRKIDSYFTSNLNLSYNLGDKIKFLRELELNLLVNNVFNEEFESNGYTFGYIFGGETIYEEFYYPQAGTNVLGGVRVKF